jgi:cytoskeletal protein CcmA (bactofilin family)
VLRSRLHVGVNIKLKGVEISDCDVLVIEGHVEATVHSKAMQIDKPGTLKGTALIDVAEIHGDFSGELTARTRLVVHGTGRVSGSIRYGKLLVADGGEISGDVKRLDAAEPPAQPIGTGLRFALRARSIVRGLPAAAERMSFLWPQALWLLADRRSSPSICSCAKVAVRYASLGRSEAVGSGPASGGTSRHCLLLALVVLWSRSAGRGDGRCLWRQTDRAGDRWPVAQ